LIKKVDELDCDYLATGHYARISFNQETGRSQLARPQDLRKDQTYFLHGITAHELQRLMFPLADIIKPEVRKIASKLNLSAAKKPDSQEICFVPKDYRIFLKQELSQIPESGEFVSVSGKILGKHLGLPFYTIGQRRGLGLSDSTPYYVVKIDKENNRVVIGKEEDLYSQTTWVSGVNWVSISPPEEPLCVSAKLRYAHHGAPATVFPESENQVRLEFDAPERAVTPGQAAVLYQDEVLLGGGWINDSP
nr:tRNA 2-thiouridine(34) synthase MnmA [SAR324 cluster bacterium]